jgi:hypothetical protein
MTLILISRGSFSGGQVMSQCLRKMAGITCLTREDLLAAVNRHGELANRITAAVPKATQHYSQFSALRHPYKILMRHALLEYARQGPTAYFGYSGHLLVPDIAHALRVRIIAPLPLRVKLMMNREKLTEDEARERIREQDEERSRWTRFMYGKTLHDPEQFDLCLNLDRLSFPTACCVMLHLSQQAEFQPTPESLAAVENHYLATTVLAALVTDPRTYELEIGATVEDGCVTLEGPYLEEPDASAVMEIARNVSGVKELKYVEGYAPPSEFAAVSAGGEQ